MDTRFGNHTREGLKEACLKAGIDEKTMAIVFYGWGGLIREMFLRGMLVGAAGSKKEYRIPKIEMTQTLSREEARIEMLRIYFEHFGPATINDCVLIPDFDQLILGYKDRDRMIDKKHLRKLTNVSGIFC